MKRPLLGVLGLIPARIFSGPRDPDLLSWACLVLAMCVLHRDSDPLTLFTWLALCASGLHMVHPGWWHTSCVLVAGSDVCDVVVVVLRPASVPGSCVCRR